MDAIGYIRVSTDKQAETGFSLDNQKNRIIAYCQFKGINLREVIEDAGISGGKNRDRPGFMRILSMVEAQEIGAVVIYSIERISRDMLTLLALERMLNEYDVELHTLDGLIDTSTPNGFINYAMRAFLGEMERRQIRFRVKSVMQSKKANGDIVGAVPYGFTRDGDSLIPNAEEQVIVDRVNKMFFEEGLSLIRISDRLNIEGVVSRNNRKFDTTQIKRMIATYVQKKKVKRSTVGYTIKNFIEQIC